VKHFNFIPRGKIRLHQKPNSAEIKACHAWLEREWQIVKPALVVALGATAAQSVFGRVMPIGKSRGRIIDLGGETRAMVTIHPSYLLRIHEIDREKEFARFVDDLRLAAPYAHRHR
jgi:DNA polymerase